MFDPMLALFPPWLLITPLLGVIHGSLFFIIVGRRPSSLPVYLVLGIAAASLFQMLQLVPLGAPPFSLGEVQLVTTSVATWALLMASRIAGL
jgi:cellulose synthase/poly-beta-1,6-N-acetylglucosamine synthase-like glycosyltransferase